MARQGRAGASNAAPPRTARGARSRSSACCRPPRKRVGGRLPPRAPRSGAPEQAGRRAARFGMATGRSRRMNARGASARRRATRRFTNVRRAMNRGRAARAQAPGRRAATTPGPGAMAIGRAVRTSHSVRDRRAIPPAATRDAARDRGARPNRFGKARPAAGRARGTMPSRSGKGRAEGLRVALLHAMAANPSAKGRRAIVPAASRGAAGRGRLGVDRCASSGDVCAAAC
jgi:hypothetical protein